MTTKSRHRKKRLRDFRSRMEGQTPEQGPFGDYLRIHAFGQPEVDVYWRYGKDVFFLQVLGRWDGRALGLYCRWHREMLYLLANLDVEGISRPVLEEAMARFVRSGVLRRPPRASVAGLVRCGVDGGIADPPTPQTLSP